MPTLSPLTCLTLGACFQIGLALALLGYLKQQFARHPEHGDRQVRVLLSLFNLALVPLILVAGLAVDFWGLRPALFAGTIFLVLALLAFGARLTLWRSVAASLVAALGSCMIGVSAVVLMPAGLLGKDEVAASLQLGMVFVALAALLTPVLLDLLLTTLGFRRTTAVFALLVLVPGFLVVLPAAEDFPATPALATLGSLAVQPAVWLAAIVFFLYAPLEAYICLWTATYLGRHGQQDRQTSWLGSFWAAMLGSRLLTALIQHSSGLGDAYDSLFLVLLALLAAVALGNMSGATRWERAYVGLIGVGLFVGPLYPMLLSVLVRLVGAREVPGTMYALMFAAGSVGSVALTPLVHYSKQAGTFQTALRIPLLIALSLTGVILLFTLLAQRQL